MRQDDKRRQREEKRRIKRAGVKHQRLSLKRQLAEAPEEAADVEIGHGRHRSAPLNGIDRRDLPPLVEGAGD